MSEDRKEFVQALGWLIAAVIVWFLTSCVPAGAQDLYSSSVSNNATAESARQLAQYQEQFLTATAQAPIINITSTAAAFQMQQSYAEATSMAAAQTQAAGMTSTAQAWTPTPNATSTAMFAQQFWTATAVYLQAERDKKTNDIRAFWSYVTGGALLVIVLFAGYVLAKRLSYKSPDVNEYGRIVPVLDTVHGTVMDPERMPNYRGETHDDLLKQLFMKWLENRFGVELTSLPQITAERQDLVTARSQMVDMATRARLPRKLLESLEAQEQGYLAGPPQLIDRFQLPSWEIINNWDGKNGIPYYTAQGLEMIDIEKFPHISVLGATSTGKSRRFLRPLIACALAAGHRVVIVGKSADYWPFEEHPNATLVTVNKITEPGQAQRYAKILEAIVVEMNRRDDVLTSMRRSTWTQAGRNRTFIVLDEVVNNLRLMDRPTSNQCRIWIEGLMSESRKVGFNIAIANQRATGIPGILSQAGKAIFRVEADEEKAHKTLLGASTLSDGYFMARFGVPKIAGGFEPTDDQIKAFLESRPVDKVDADDQWIDAVVTDAPAKLPKKNEESSQASEKSSTAEEDKTELVRQLHAQGVSNTQIVYRIWGKAGSEFNERMEQVKQIIATAATATASKSPDMSLEGAAAGQ